MLITGGLFSLTWALIKTSTATRGRRPTCSASWPLAAALLVGFVVWELRQRDPMVPLGFFQNRVFSISNMVVLMVGFAMFGVIYFITLYFQNIHGYSPKQAGLRSLPLTMMVVLVAPIAGRLNTRVGPRPLMSIGMAGMTLGLLGLSRRQVDTSYWAIWPFYVLMGAGISMTMPSVSSAAMGSVDPTKAGIASGVVNWSRQVGGALGVAVFGSIGAALTISQWEDKLDQIGAPAAAHSDTVEQLVIGGQGDLIGQVVGQAAGAARARRRDRRPRGVRARRAGRDAGRRGAGVRRVR